MSLSQFLEAVEVARREPDRSIRLGVIADAMEAHGHAVAQASPVDRERLMLMLASVPGLSGQVATIRRALSPEPVPAVRLAASGESRPPLDLDGSDLPELWVPHGWIATDAGITMVCEDGDPLELSSRPIVATGILRDADTGLERVRLEWRATHGWDSAIVRMSETQDPRAFVRLADAGAPVAGHSARHLGRWISDLIERNPGLPRARSTQRLGWVGDGFMLGRTYISPRGESEAGESPSTWDTSSVALDISAEDGRSQLVDAYARAGDFASWCALFAEASRFPSASIGVYLAIAAPALRAIPGAPNPILEWAGETSRGKTTAMMLAASVWGEPSHRGLIQKWGATPKGLEEIWKTNDCLPTFLDDTKNVPAQARESMGDHVYTYSGGRGRMRGTITGMASTAAFRGVLVSTGESPITSYRQDAGARARVLGLSGSPWGGVDQSALVDRIQSDAMEHHGHAGLLAVRWLVAHPEAHVHIESAYHEADARWGALASDPIARRAAHTVALIEVGLRIARKIGMPDPIEDPIAYAWTAATGQAVDADRPAQALRDIYSWCLEHSAEMWGRHVVDHAGEPRQPSAGWAGAWSTTWDRIGLSTPVIRRLLRREGHEPSGILQSWHDRGWLICEAQRMESKMTLGPTGGRTRMTVIRRSAIEEVQDET